MSKTRKKKLLHNLRLKEQKQKKLERVLEKREEEIKARRRFLKRVKEEERLKRERELRKNYKPVNTNTKDQYRWAEGTATKKRSVLNNY